MESSNPSKEAGVGAQQDGGAWGTSALTDTCWPSTQAKEMPRSLEVPLFLTGGRGGGIRADRELRPAQVQDRAVGQRRRRIP